jgi:hypothetical protein
MRLAATFHRAKAEAVHRRVDYRSVNQVRAGVILGNAARENGDTLAGRNEFELFLDCGGAPDVGIQRCMDSEVSQDEPSLRGQRVIDGQVGNAEPRRKTHHQARAAARGLVYAPSSCSGPGEYIDGFVLQLSSGLGEPYSAGCALQRRAAELLFERADLPTKHRLGYVQMLSRTSERTIP